ncbi:MAG: hypothetical protein AAF824_12775 [Bacteroidota bacterium]
MRILLLYSFLFAGLSICRSQSLNEFDQWALRVGWDGITPWQFFINTAPATLGPNALPPPRLQQGRVKNDWKLELRPEYHFGSGDRTYDFFSRIYVPIVQDKVALELFWVAFESYDMDTDIRDLRNARTSDGKGVSIGDIHISTIIQLLRDHPSLPDVTLNISIKTASGEKLDDARYTDAPGYYFDFSAGKTLSLNQEGTQALRWHLMAGFYVWQIYDITQRQNDALSYGGGIDWFLGKWKLGASLAGYLGYIDNGDKPLILESVLQFTPGKFSPSIGYRNGLNDYPYQTIFAAATITF